MHQGGVIMHGLSNWFPFVHGKVPARVLSAMLLVGVLSPLFVSRVRAQSVEIGEICDCGILITRLVNGGIIDEDDAQEAWEECTEVMC